MGKLALLALLAIPLLVENADDRFRVDTERHFLYLRGLVEQRIRLSLSLLGGPLLAVTGGLLGVFAFLLCARAGFELGNSFLGDGALLVLHAKGLVLDSLFDIGLLGGGFFILFWCHVGQLCDSESAI